MCVYYKNVFVKRLFLVVNIMENKIFTFVATRFVVVFDNSK